MPLMAELTTDAAGKTRGVVHHVEEILHIARIVADEPQLEVLDDLHRRFIGAGRIRLADADRCPDR